MVIREYTAEVKGGLLLELPTEAEVLHLQPGDKVTVKLDQNSPTTPQIIPDSVKRPSALGKYSFVAGGSDEFAKEKQTEITREDRSR